MTRALLTAGLAALAFASTAQAAGPPTNAPVPTRRVADSVKVAQAFWHRPLPCHLHVYAASQASLQDVVDHSALPVGTRLLEAAQIGLRPGQTDCSLWIDAKLLTPSIEHRVKTCTVLVHGLGHVYGLYDEHQHPHSVMSGLDTPMVQGCYRRFVPRGKGAWWRQTYGRPAFATWPTLEALR
jgi:hypothetical protein